MSRIVVCLMLALALPAPGAEPTGSAKDIAGAVPAAGALERTAVIEVPGLLSFQGRLLDDQKLPVPDTVYPVAFRLFTQPEGGTPVWQEEQQVRTDDGLFALMLGSENPIGDPPGEGELFLGMQVAGEPEMMPRVRIGSAVYSLLAQRAADADRLQGQGLDSLDQRYVRPGQPEVVTTEMLAEDAVTSDRVEDHSLQREDVVPWFTAPYCDTAEYARNGGGGGGSVASVAESTGVRCVPNPITTTGRVMFDAVWGDGRYVNTGQPNSVATGMVINGTIAREDVASNFVAPFADTAEYARNAPGGSGTVEFIAHDTGLICTPNPITSGGTIRFSTVFGDGRYLNQTGDSVMGTLAVQGDLRGYGRLTWGPACRSASSYSSALGYQDTAAGMCATVSGGQQNVTTQTHTTIGGGFANRVTGAYSTVSGGWGNVVAGQQATVGGGLGNTARGEYATVAGGWTNDAGGQQGTVAGGASNTASGTRATVGGGWRNLAESTAATVAGGQYNTASGEGAVVAGGENSMATNEGATVGGGFYNRARGVYSTVGGGYGNIVEDDSAGCSTVAGGRENLARGGHAFVGGGQSDTASGAGAVVVGGMFNIAEGEGATVGGGVGNTAEGDFATVAGGYNNEAGRWATVCGGDYNAARGDFSVVVGGRHCEVDGGYALAGGYLTKVKAGGLHSFAWGENCSTSTPRAVVFYHSGAPTRLGVGVQDPTHNIDVAGGAYCDGANWVNASSRRLKRDIEVLTPGELAAVLVELDRTEVVRYRYRGDGAGEEHIGLIAEDAPELLATSARDGINTADAIGWLIAALKAQQVRIEGLERRLAGGRQ